MRSGRSGGIPARTQQASERTARIGARHGFRRGGGVPLDLGPGPATAVCFAADCRVFGRPHRVSGSYRAKRRISGMRTANPFRIRRLALLEHTPSVILIVAAVNTLIGLACWLFWRATGEAAWVTVFFRYPNAILTVLMGATEV